MISVIVLLFVLFCGFFCFVLVFFWYVWKRATVGVENAWGFCFWVCDSEFSDSGLNQLSSEGTCWYVSAVFK